MVEIFIPQILTNAVCQFFFLSVGDSVAKHLLDTIVATLLGACQGTDL